MFFYYLIKVFYFFQAFFIQLFSLLSQLYICKLPFNWDRSKHVVFSFSHLLTLVADWSDHSWTPATLFQWGLWQLFNHFVVTLWLASLFFHFLYFIQFPNFAHVRYYCFLWALFVSLKRFWSFGNYILYFLYSPF